MPASVLFRNGPWRTGVGGTIWAGEVGVAGGSVFAWRMAPLRSLTSLAFAADWTAKGPATDLGGRMLVHPGGRIVLDKVSGRADGTLLAALQPDLPFTCDVAMQIEMDRIAIGGGARMLKGKALTEPGSCQPKKAGMATTVPALALSAEHVGTQSMVRIAPAGQRRRTLLSAELSEAGALGLTVTAEGAAALPFLGAPAGMRIDGTL